MKLTFDQNLFTQTALDSGSLNMLGTLVHSLSEPGQYRCAVYRGTENIASCQIVAHKDSPVAQANIDLSILDPSIIDAPSLSVADQEPRCCGGGTHGSEAAQFTVNPKGYVVFHVSSGAGGYAVTIRKAAQDPSTSIFDSRELSQGDVYSAAIIRPGTYSLENVLTKAKGQAVVAYPRMGDTAYRPPAPVEIQCSAHQITPERVDLQPGQGLNFRFDVRSRIKIELLKADDGPGKPLGPNTRGWRRATLPKTHR
jgi:hypothetical protein